MEKTTLSRIFKNFMDSLTEGCLPYAIKLGEKEYSDAPTKNVLLNFDSYFKNTKEEFDFTVIVGSADARHKINSLPYKVNWNDGLNFKSYFDIVWTGKCPEDVLKILVDDEQFVPTLNDEEELPSFNFIWAEIVDEYPNQKIVDYAQKLIGSTGHCYFRLESDKHLETFESYSNMDCLTVNGKKVYRLVKN